MGPMGASFELVGRRADGRTFPADVMLKALKHLAEPTVPAVIRDDGPGHDGLRNSNSSLTCVSESLHAMLQRRSPSRRQPAACHALDGIVTVVRESSKATGLPARI
jgi:hypothetical protein